MSGFDLQSHGASVYVKLIQAGLRSGLYRYNDDGDLEKFCDDCCEYWPADDEFFQSCAQAIDGISKSCRACCAEVKRTR